MIQKFFKNHCFASHQGQNNEVLGMKTLREGPDHFKAKSRDFQYIIDYMMFKYFQWVAQVVDTLWFIRNVEN